jgi:hypothetical protein
MAGQHRLEPILFHHSKAAEARWHIPEVVESRWLGKRPHFRLAKISSQGGQLRHREIAASLT